jgi:hypothetical protein
MHKHMCTPDKCTLHSTSICTQHTFALMYTQCISWALMHTCVHHTLVQHVYTPHTRAHHTHTHIIHDTHTVTHTDTPHTPSPAQTFTKSFSSVVTRWEHSLLLSARCFLAPPLIIFTLVPHPSVCASGWVHPYWILENFRVWPITTIRSPRSLYCLVATLLIVRPASERDWASLRSQAVPAFFHLLSQLQCCMEIQKYLNANLFCLTLVSSFSQILTHKDTTKLTECCPSRERIL